MVVVVAAIIIDHPVARQGNGDQVTEEEVVATMAIAAVNGLHGAHLWNGDQSVVDGVNRLEMVGSHLWRVKNKRRIRG